MIYDTVGELIDYLQNFPSDTPITESYDGTGRIGAVSFGVDDKLHCVAVFPVTISYLQTNSLPLDNPALVPVDLLLSN